LIELKIIIQVKGKNQTKFVKVGFEVGGNLLNKLWKPQPNITKEIDRYVNEIFRNHFIIGIQIRSEYITDPIDTKTFLNCANEIEANLTLTNQNQNKSVKWFIASDIKHMLDRLANEYPDKIVLSNGSLGHIDLVSHENSYYRAILDVELLSKCDELVLTGGSTFGLVSAMKQLKMPYYINGRINMNKCVRMSMGDPPLTPKKLSVFRK
jgi:hypothetical protein